MARNQRKLKVVWSRTAESQLQQILTYWLKRNGSPAYPQKLYEAIHERIQLLSYYPELGKPTDFKTTQQSVLGHHSILYRHEGEFILISAIWDNRDDPKKLYEVLSKKG
jgi:plasmid stabilization system protein ParE